jgi:hypothetical protein
VRGVLPGVNNDNYDVIQTKIGKFHVRMLVTYLHVRMMSHMILMYYLYTSFISIQVKACYLYYQETKLFLVVDPFALVIGLCGHLRSLNFVLNRVARINVSVFTRTMYNP